MFYNAVHVKEYDLSIDARLHISFPAAHPITTTTLPRSEPGASVHASCLVDGAIKLDRCACQHRHAFWPGGGCGGHDRARL